MAWNNSKNNSKNRSKNNSTNVAHNRTHSTHSIRRRWLLAPAYAAAFAVAGLGVSACASWDEPSAHQNLKKDVVESGADAEPRSFHGGNIVEALE